uniref:folate gamma-glutamyl hydrolase n=1 Tax=Pseudodiaptomus poplesia TaxID=213370 RepID=A0A0U2LFU9_9MAXI|nr:gamma-glutamyl hydrolase [Pseudodiaptomus poplesia]
MSRAKELITLLCILTSQNVLAQNAAPVIGIISQPISHSLDYLSPGGTYIAASYVKWIESVGGRVVPLIAGSSQQNHSQLFESLNGILIPGGGNSIYDSSYASLGKEAFEFAKAANERGEYFPIWGTCLGFELLGLLSIEGQHYLKRCSASNIHLPLEFLPEWEQSKIFREASDGILDSLSSQNITANFHVWCLTMENFTKFEMDRFWLPITISHDEDGVEFISTMEARDYPFYGTQFHPEKNNFEFPAKYPEIPHSREAVEVSIYFASFFVNDARKSQQTFPTNLELEQNLIYNHKPVFVGTEEINSGFMQIYIFDKEI